MKWWLGGGRPGGTGCECTRRCREQCWQKCRRSRERDGRGSRQRAPAPRGGTAASTATCTPAEKACRSSSAASEPFPHVKLARTLLVWGRGWWLSCDLTIQVVLTQHLRRDDVGKAITALLRLTRDIIDNETFIEATFNSILSLEKRRISSSKYKQVYQVWPLQELFIHFYPSRDSQLLHQKATS